MPQPRTLLLVHPQPSQLEPLCEALRADFTVLLAGSTQEAWPLLVSYPVDLVVADEVIGLPFLEELEQRAPSLGRVLLFDGQGVERLVKAMNEGHVFITLPRALPPEKLVQQLRSMVYPRVAERQRPEQPLTVRLQLDPAAPELERALVDISHQGLAFQLTSTDPLAAFIPGSPIRSLSVWQNGRPLLEKVEGWVRHLDPLGNTEGNGSAPGYKVGVEFAGESHSNVEATTVVRDLVEKVALLREALHRKTLQLRRSDEEEKALRVELGHVDVERQQLLLTGTFPSDWQAGEVIHAHLDSAGGSYSFLSSLLERSAPGETSGAVELTLKLPRILRAVRRRTSRRHQLGGEGAFSVEFFPLGSTQSVLKPVLDISGTGLSFLNTGSAGLMPLGLLLDPVKLHLPGNHVLEARARVLNVAPLQREGGPYFKCGISLEGLSRSDQSLIADAILSTATPGVEDGGGLHFSELWAFLKESGFIYPEKEEKLQRTLPSIARNLDILLEKPNPILKTLVFRHQGKLQGHISALQTYSRTWLIQHLASMHGGLHRPASGRILNLAIAQYSEQLPEMEFLQMYFRPTNVWAARTFGQFARLKFNREGCDLRTFSYLVAPSDKTPAAAPEGVELRRATVEDCAQMEAWWLGHHSSLVARATDLWRDRFELSGLATPYRTLDLERRREAYVARRGDKLLGFALLEISSPGLNFSEITNTFRIHLVEENLEVLQALARYSRARYAELGRPLSIALTERSDLTGYQSAGFTKVKEYCCWTVHRSLSGRYCEFIRRRYERIESPRAPAATGSQERTGL